MMAAIGIGFLLAIPTGLIVGIIVKALWSMERPISHSAELM